MSLMLTNDRSGIVLDALNVTIDKPRTIAALRSAEQSFLRKASEIRAAGGEESLSRKWDDEAAVVFALISQMEMHGGNANESQKPN